MMNELNIYIKFDYEKFLTKVNNYFNDNEIDRKEYKRTVFAPEDKGYVISINRNNIYITYFNEEGLNIVNQFINENIVNQVIILQYNNQVDEVITNLKNRNTVIKEECSNSKILISSGV